MRKLFILIPFLLIVSVASSEEINRDSSKECAVCHYEWMPEFVDNLKGTDIVGFQSERVVATEKMCFSCHNGTVGDSRIKIWSGDMHKLADKIPEQMQVPESIPLDNGRINCRTCHTAHATSDPKAEGVEKSVFLRVKNEDSQLCELCHGDIGDGEHHSHPLKTPEKDYTDIEKRLHSLDAKLGRGGRVVCQSCHTSHSAREKKLLIYQESDSKLCSICHTDKVDPEGAGYLRGMLNHPINVTHDNGAEVARVKAAGGVYGEDNEVICLTCHNTHKGATESLLIRRNGDSGLCIACHENKKDLFAGKHDMHKVQGFRTKDGKTARDKGICGCCHDPHGWSLDLPPMGDGDLISRGCLSCHQEGGFAAKKVLAANRFSHPVGIEVTAEMPVDALPLFPKATDHVSQFGSENNQKNCVTCATCHDVHSKDKNMLRAPAESGRLCLTCHNDKKMIEPTGHGGRKLDKNCLSCHKVHNSESKRLLNIAENDGCLECHKKGGGAEKLAVDVTYSHPVNMPVKETLKEGFKTTPEGMFTCVSCHDPHKASKRDAVRKDFLRGEYTTMDGFCTACHENRKEVIGSDHDHRKRKTDSVCGQCHKVHNAETTENLMSPEYDYKERDDNCRACHNEKGAADKKVVMDGHPLGRIDRRGMNTRHLTEKDGDFFIYCSSCHTVHNNGPVKGEDGNCKNSFLNRKIFDNGSLCVGCHEERKAFAASNSKHHVKTFKTHTETTKTLKSDGDACGACHRVHNSGFYLFDDSLGEDVEKICAGCHSDDGPASRTIISTSHKPNLKKMNVERDVYLQEGKMVCLTCHEPHSDKDGMFREIDAKEKNVCVACHEDRKMAALAGHNLSRIDYLEDEVKKDARRNVCLACHKAHNFDENNRLMWRFAPKWREVFAFKMCTDCHAEEGAGYKKIPEVFTHDKIFKIIPAKVKARLEEYLFDDDGIADINGNITCQTCHDPHGGETGMTATKTGGKGTAENRFLKQGVREGFCADCHGETPSKALFEKFHDRDFRESRNKKQGEAGVLRNLMRIQMNLQKIQEVEKAE